MECILQRTSSTLHHSRAHSRACTCCAPPAAPAGVHLNISCVLKLLSRHPDVLPFLVHIASEDKHVERMAVRAKYMTLDPNKNR